MFADFIYSAAIMGLGLLLYRTGYRHGREDGAQHYREQEAERMTRTGTT